MKIPIDACFSSRVWAIAAFIVIPTTDMGSAEIPAAAAVKQSQRVLVLYSDDRLLPANVIIDDAIRATFAVGTNSRVEFHSEFFDAVRFPGEAHEQQQRDYLREKYRQRRPDLLIAVSGGAASFLVKNQAGLLAEPSFIVPWPVTSAEGSAG